MRVFDLPQLQRRFDMVQTVIRRIHAEVLPRSERRIARATESLSSSLSRELESTQRLLDPERR